MSETTDLLAKVPLLSGLDQKHLERLSRDFTERTFPAGSVVVKEGDTHGMGFFVVAEGEGEVTVHGDPRGRIGPGDYFGEIALLTGSDRTATITATTEMRCYGMTPWDFRPLVEGHADIAWKLLQTMAQRLSQQ